MKTYPKNKFLEMTLERRLQVLLDTIYLTEKVWEHIDQRLSCLSLLRDYFQWMDFYEIDSPVLRRISSYQNQLDDSLSLRQLLDLAVPMERFLELGMKDDNFIWVKEGDAIEKQRQTLPIFFVLDHLRSAFNVGSLFRTAECLGVQHIYLVGYTPSPEDAGVRKTAMGTESSVSWSSHQHLEDVVKDLESKGVPLIALETAATSKSLLNWKAPSSLALLVGNERFGLNQKSLQAVEDTVEIPLMGQKNSLNVANALSVVTFEVIRQWQI